METRRLGRTGHRSSLAVLGGAAFWDASPERTERAFADALAAGVNHLDVAPQYGRAQELLGPCIPAARDGLFVGCKTLRRNAEGVRAQLEESLTLLRCDHFDLYQLHAVTSLQDLEDRADAVGAVLRARDEGLCRFVGITGHELTAPAAHLQALRRYDLDTVMFPVNARLWADAAYRRDAEALLEEAAARDVGVMAIKAVAARPWGDRTRTHGTWYEPYADLEDVEPSVRFTLSVEGIHAFCTPGDLTVLPLTLQAAERFSVMPEPVRAVLVGARADEAHIFPMPRG